MDKFSVALMGLQLLTHSDRIKYRADKNQDAGHQKQINRKTFEFIVKVEIERQECRQRGKKINHLFSTVSLTTRLIPVILTENNIKKNSEKKKNISISFNDTV
jgi:hypothetical protein